MKSWPIPNTSIPKMWHLIQNVAYVTGLSFSQLLVDITKTRLYKYILKILPPKNENFQIKKSDIFHISAQNIDCGYSLEPPHRGGSNEYHNLCFEQK